MQRLLARSSLRRHAGGAIGIVVVLALGLGAALTAVEAADRTASAYPDHLRRSDVADLVVNPVLANERTEELIEATPGIRRVVSDSLLTAAPADDPDGGSLLQVRVSQDGRYVDQDRPVVHDGRMVRSGDEAFLSTAAAEALAVEVGDVVELGFFGINREDPTGIELGPMVRRVELTVVGIGAFADTVLADELSAREYAVITPEAAGSADCRQAVFDGDDPRSSEELLLASVPPDCAMTYRFYSLDVEGEAAAVAADLGRRFQEANRELPASMRAAGVGWFLIPSFTEDDERSIAQALAPAVASLRVFGIVAGLTAVGAALVLAVRQFRRRQRELATWRELGLGTTGRVVAIGTLPLAAAALGVALALVVALVASPLGPVASARAVVPHPGHGLGAASLLAALAALALLGAGIAVAAWRRVARRPVEEVRSGGRVPTGLSPLVALGVVAATRGRDAVAAAAGVAVAVAAVTATLLYALAIGDMVGDPDRYGWTVDAAVLANYGYGPIDLDAVRDDLDRPDVEAWGNAFVTGDLTLDGETVPALAGREGFDDLLGGLPVVDGRLPSGEDEVAVGVATADELSLGLGDRVTIGSPFGERDATLTGFVVLPDIGPLQSDRTSLATGLLVPGPLLLEVFAGTEEAAGVPAADYVDAQAAIVMIDAAAGADVDALAADVEAALPRWDPTGFGIARATPVRPPTIVDLADVRGVPAALAGLFAAAMVAAVLAGLTTGVRNRRHELAVVRALGATRRQRRASVRVHALTTVALGTVVGLPVGVALGRLASRRLSQEVGVVDDVVVPVLLVVGVAAGVLVLALVAAEVLARSAQRLRPSQISRRTAGPKSSLWT